MFLRGIAARGRVLVVVFLLVFGVALLSGCSAGPQSGASTVTKAEYFAATQRAAQCIRDKGYVAEEPREVYDSYQVGFGMPEGAEGEDDPMDVYDACWNEYAKPTEDAYFESLALTGAEWEADYREMIVCMEAAGITGLKVGDEAGVVGQAIEIGSYPGQEGDIQVNDQGFECLQQHLSSLFQETE